MIDRTLATEILDAAEGRREDLIQLCSRLVSARSVNPPGDTREMAELVVAALGELDIAADRASAVDSMPSVIARIDSGRPGRHLVVNVHLDTMPPGDEGLWSVPPWTMTRRDGRLYGLGMGNMKGAVAAMIHAVGFLHQRRSAWRGRVTFTAVSDEVVFGNNGAAHLITTYPDLLGDAMICGEGAGFGRLAVGEKGVLWLRLHATADPGHSSAVQSGTSASARMARAVTAVDALTGRRGSLSNPMELLDEESELRLTANVGTIRSGTFVGQIATEATAEVDLRLPPGISADQAESMVRDAVERAVPDGPVSVSRIKGWDPNLTADTAAIVTSWRNAESAADQIPAQLAIRLPASDASRWRALGTPAICFGPQPTFSSGVDDYADEDEVVRCSALYALAALDFLSVEDDGDDR